MIDDEIELAPQRATAPPKRWRNRWEALEDLINRFSGAQQKGARFWSGRTWPSREIAEQKAAEDSVKEVNMFGRPIARHLGAFPVNED